MATRLLYSKLIFIIAINSHAENRVNTKLITDTEIAAPGSTIRIGILFEIPPRSHIYWHNPGDSGLPTSIEWTADTSIKTGELQWPAPTQFHIEGLDNEAYFGYTNQVLLFSQFKIPQEPKSHITISAEVSWLLCLDDGACIPEDQQLDLSIKVGEPPRKSYEATLFDKYAQSVPIPLKTTSIQWQTKPQTQLTIQLLNNIDPESAPAQYFPNSGGAWSLHTRENKTITFRPNYSEEKIDGGILLLPTNQSNTTQTIQIPPPQPELYHSNRLTNKLNLDMLMKARK